MGLPDFVFDGSFSLSGALWSSSGFAPDLCVGNKVAGAITTVTSVAVSLVAEAGGGVSASDELLPDSEVVLDGAGEAVALADESKSGFLT